MNNLFDVIPIISSLLTIIAILVGLYVAMRWLESQDLQRKELSYQREELHNMREETRKSANKCVKESVSGLDPSFNG